MAAAPYDPLIQGGYSTSCLAGDSANDELIKWTLMLAMAFDIACSG